MTDKKEIIFTQDHMKVLRAVEKGNKTPEQIKGYLHYIEDVFWNLAYIAELLDDLLKFGLINDA